jgi:hypothetical protein
MTMCPPRFSGGARGHRPAWSSPLRDGNREMAMTKLGDYHVHHQQHRGANVVMAIAFPSFRFKSSSGTSEVLTIKMVWWGCIKQEKESMPVFRALNTKGKTKDNVLQ